MNSQHTLRVDTLGQSRHFQLSFSLWAMLFMLISVLAMSANAAASDLTLAWNWVADSRVTGYELHYGEASGAYSKSLQSATNSQAVSGLEAGKTYYFAVKAFNSDRSLDSPFSNEVSTTIPYPAPEAGFTMSASSGVAPLTVAFSDTSTSKVDNWQWSFGDGATSSQSSPTYTFTTPGTYTVSLMVSGPGGAALKPAQAVVTVATPAPLAAFVMSGSAGQTPFVVQFTDRSTGVIDSWEWDLGDGNTSTERSPSHVYLKAGEYLASLRVRGPGGVSAQAATAKISVVVPPPVAGFSESATSGVAPMSLVFTDVSSGDVTACEWDFGDGGRATGSQAVWTYQEPGTYSVTLKVTGAGGSDIMTKTNLVTVAGPPPVADFDAANRVGNAPLSVAFRDLSSGEISQVTWNFGDGQISAERNPTHVYEEAGSYDVTLSVTGPHGDHSVTKSAFVEVKPKDSSLPIEVGEVMVDHTWQWVEFGRSFIDPVVVANPPSINDAASAVVRISGVESTGFWIRIQEWDYLDGEHGFETVSYVAMEKGSHVLPSGERIEAGTFTQSGRWYSSFGFAEAFPTTPVVFAGVSSTNDAKAVTTRVRDVTAQGFRVRMDEQELLTAGHGAETVSYIAWQPSQGTLDGLQFAVGMKAKGASDQASTLSFGDGFAEIPVFLAHMQTANGGDPTALRHRNLSATGVELIAQEEQSKDAEMTHLAEDVGWAAFQNEDQTPKIIEVGEVVVDHTWQWVEFGRSFIDPVVVANPPSLNDAASAVVRISGVEPTGFWIRIQEWDYLDGEHGFETVSYVAMEKGSHVLPSGERIEAGTFTQSGRWYSSFGFAEAFPTTPVVFAGVSSTNDAKAVTTRVRDVTAQGFRVRMDEQELLTAGHGAETVSYIAWQPSQGTLDGLQFAVGMKAKGASDQASTLSFGDGFAEIPVFLAHMQTANGGDPTALRHRNLSATGVELIAQEEQSKDAEMTHLAEDVAWAIFQ
ncbi:PKD repeat-containing protein [Thiocapsa roseopersicina]|uniref:PKD repeat-containing protein n=2 Tax=Thiocapsa roseopersicina TaxID=1058 RepID=A0A1H2Y2X9_THIRO|nr:PKD repeat-containing protein [Thiocapsa roseopersicina]